MNNSSTIDDHDPLTSQDEFGLDYYGSDEGQLVAININNELLLEIWIYGKFAIMHNQHELSINLTKYTPKPQPKTPIINYICYISTISFITYIIGALMRLCWNYHK